MMQGRKREWRDRDGRTQVLTLDVQLNPESAPSRCIAGRDACIAPQGQQASGDENQREYRSRLGILGLGKPHRVSVRGEAKPQKIC